MEINEGNFQSLAQYLQQTLNPDENLRVPGKNFEVMLICLLRLLNRSN